MHTHTLQSHLFGFSFNLFSADMFSYVFFVICTAQMLISPLRLPLPCSSPPSSILACAQVFAFTLIIVFVLCGGERW